MDLFSDPEPAAPLPHGAAPAPALDPFAAPGPQHSDGLTGTANPPARADTPASA
jgi:hypothetical protein